MKQIYLFIVLGFITLNCTKKSKEQIGSVKTYEKRAEHVDWHFKYPTDSTAGIGIDSAMSFLKNRQHNDVVVALIDGLIDIRHEDLINVIYTNPNEIDGNGIDDDANGYIDDIHGWNYLGKKDGTTLIYGQYDVSRRIKLIEDKYKLTNFDTRTRISESIDEKEYLELKEYQKSKIDKSKRTIKWGNEQLKNYVNFQKYYPEIIQIGDKYTFQQWDSIKNTVVSKEIENAIKTWVYFKRYTISYSRLIELVNTNQANLSLMYNPNIDPYSTIDDDPDNPNYTGYGHGFVGLLPHKYDHGTKMAGIIAGEWNNGIGVRGVAPHAKIMPLEVYPSANERDKDFANAVKYAADNGAKIINYSMSKRYVIDSLTYYNAIRYATKKGVLFVCSGGNDAKNHDLIPLGERHPSFALDYPGVIKVGSSSQFTDGRLVAASSNYGKKSIDVFAPGVDVLTSEVYEKKYYLSYGTSGAAACVSGLAALIWSYYPDFKSFEIEKIIKESGTTYDVEIKTKEGLKSFQELSQTGKVVNAYNAVLLAEKLYKEKQKK